MATFYGMIRGHRGAATRIGSKDSGFKVAAQSYDGSVITRLDYDSENKLKVRIEISDRSNNSGETYFEGTLEELKKKLRG